MTRNPRGNTAQTHGRIRTPPQMDRIRRENVLIERPSNGTGKYVWLVQRISIWIGVQHFEKRVEVVGGLIYVKDRDGAARTYALAYIFNCNPHRGEGGLALRRSVIGDAHGPIIGAEPHLSNCLLQERNRQSGAAGRKLRVLVVGAIP